ncbi:MAG: hypothetical protein ACUBOA_05710 [Candidatus Loosdrechtia sp.]
MNKQKPTTPKGWHDGKMIVDFLCHPFGVRNLLYDFCYNHDIPSGLENKK